MNEQLETSAPALTPARPGSAAPWSRMQLLQVFGLLLLVALALRLPGYVVDVFNTDETFLATQAEVIKDGGNLYREAADRKPPLVPYIYAGTFTLFGTTALWSVRVMAAVAVALTGLLVAAEARARWGRRAGWLAGILLVLATGAFVPQDGQAANFEIFMLPPMTAAVLLARRGRGFSSGVAVAVATLAKQTGAATLLPVLYLMWKHRGRRGAGDALLGFGALIAAVALFVGPGQLLFWAVLGNGSYLSDGAASFLVILLFASMTLLFAALNLPIVWTLPQAWRERHTYGRGDVDLWLWLASAALSVTVGFRFFGHYYLQLLPPLALLAAGVLARMSARLVKQTVALAASIAAVLVLLAFPDQPIEYPEYEDAAEYVATHAGPDDQILVWGHVPEIYWASGAQPATRFLTNRFLTGSWAGRPEDTAADPEAAATPGAWELFFQDLASHPPRYILDAAPAGIRESGSYPIDLFPRFDAIVSSQYRRVTVIDGITIYERVPQPTFEKTIW
jgi:MFS family permease